MENGDLFSEYEKDSLVNLGLKIQMNNKFSIGDSVFIDFNILETQHESPFQQKFEGNFMPFTELYSLNNIKIGLPKKSQVYMINIWSTTCGPCIAEIPQLNDLKAKYKKQVEFIAIAPESEKEISDFLREHNFQFLIFSSPEFFKAHNINGYPKNLFIDQNGVVVKTKEGTPLKRIEGEWKISVFDDYSVIIDKLLIK